jgi:hypothetical protein
MRRRKGRSSAYGQEVSRIPASPVAEVATKIGRAVSGVYNKVMNFRSIDPRDARAGMSGSGEVDRAVWNEFFDNDAGALRLADLESEFNRLWNSSAIAAVPPSGPAQPPGTFDGRLHKIGHEFPSEPRNFVTLFSDPFEIFMFYPLEFVPFIARPRGDVVADVTEVAVHPFIEKELGVQGA